MLFQSIYQYNLGKKQEEQAKNLKMGDYTDLYAQNRDLAMQQAYSRRAPGQSNAEEMIRRNTANQIGAAQRMYGGDVNKIAAISSAATAKANDATNQLQMRGQSFSEDAFRRLYQSNKDLQAGKQEYMRAKQALLQSAQQNYYNAIPEHF